MVTDRIFGQEKSSDPLTAHMAKLEFRLRFPPSKNINQARSRNGEILQSLLEGTPSSVLIISLYIYT